MSFGVALTRSCSTPLHMAQPIYYPLRDSDVNDSALALALLVSSGDNDGVTDLG